MPSPRELQPHLSAAVNQAVMRGMAVESRFRPATVAEWLKLLPGDGVTVVTPSVPTHTVATINLSLQEQENLFGRTAKKQINVPTTLKNARELAQKLAASKVFIGMSVAVIAGTAGFGITSMLPKSQPQSPSQPVFAQPTKEPTAEAPVVNTTPSPANEETKTSTSDEVTPVSTSSRRRRNRRVYQNNSQDESSSRRSSEQPSPTPSPSPSSSLVETLRAIKSSRNASPAPTVNNSSSTPKDSAAPQTEKPSNPVVIPASPTETKLSDPPAVVVPTQEVKQNSTTDNPQKVEKSPDKPTEDNN